MPRGKKTTKALATKTYVKKAIARRKETKHYNVYAEDVSLDTAPTIVSLTAMTQGDGDQQRDGDTIFLKNIDFRWMARMPTTSRAAIRVMLFRWYDDSTPVATDILLSGSTAIRNINGPPSHDNKQLYKIMVDRRYNLYYTNGRFPISLWRIFGKRLGRKQVQFQNGTTNGVGKVYLMVMSEIATGANSPTFSYYSHITYTD